MGRKSLQARDSVMARLAACRAELAAAISTIDVCLEQFVDPTLDPKGKKRTESFEAIDDLCGSAAHAVQAAQESWGDVDPAQGEPGVEEDEDDEDEDDEDEDDEDEDDDE